MMAAGVLLPVIEVLNTGVFKDENQEAHISPQVLTTSAVLIGTGAIMAFSRKQYFKPGRKYHLIIVDKRSPFYKEKPVDAGYTSPLIPR